ncbi:MAG: hypothetical protein C7B46_07855 [Sulfobacillus benefaciens]|uniref:Polyketide cyclase n=1 Tax=Sulfobacillus benefaciens TaxID=453960 RepID=A0A2T2XHF8_9FIRM|nr:MAG: hypothetical protein C7B46_07855 [Sulfobacillus benefaciens]
MWNFEHTITTQAELTQIWRLYADVTLWPQWDLGVEGVSLNGPFVAGTRGFLTLKEQNIIPFELTVVEPLREFSDVSYLTDAGIAIHFTHRLESVEEGIQITHLVSINGDNAEALAPALGVGFTADIPETMERLAALAISLEGGTR